MTCHAILARKGGQNSWSLHSSDLDVVCAVEGEQLDFRSELGRYFLCECKDWKDPVDFSATAKFSRMLDSARCKSGIIFSRQGITGKGKDRDAERELLKVLQDRGIVIMVVNEEDIKRVIAGHSFITLLRQRYETVRLDLATLDAPAAAARATKKTTRKATRKKRKARS